MKNLILGGVILLPLFISSCNKSTPERPLTALEASGKAAYMSNCIACHHPDPKLSGSIGPDIAGSSLELVHMRIMEAKYPVGYTPKRDSKMMAAHPHLEKDIPSIHAYLNSFKK